MGDALVPGVWRLHDAKAQFSLVVDSALGGVPQYVTKRGKRAVVVLSEHDYLNMQRNVKAQAPNFIGHLLAIPKTPKAPAQKASSIAGPAPKPPTTRASRPALYFRDVDF